ncbi:MAG: ABC transporter substrate-binding protein [Desulfobacterota bacterium]|nr:ABC transporter substrate-binding protein [Thermodesulfobacteriota bacterium]MDW8002440.1 ABC transporter substrate-binding protein [Deltaproteobacteria bacterium]
MKKKVVLFFVFAFGILTLLPSQSLSQKTIKVGIVDTYTGPPTTFTFDVRDGFDLAVREINKAGGVMGRTIEYTTRDEKFKPDVGLAMAKELLMKEKVDILMGTINSATALAISDLAKKEKVPFFVTFAKSEKITGEQGHRYVFGISENTEMAGRAAAFALSKMPYTKYWIAGDDYEYGHSIANAVWRHLTKLNPKVTKIGETWWKVGEADFTPYITQILAAKPDFIIVATGGAAMVNFQRAAKATGLAEKIPFYQHTAIEHSVLMPQGLDAPEGVYGTCNYFFYYPDTKENRAFVDQFRKAYNRYPKIGALYGYVTAKLIAEGFKKAKSFDIEKFIDAVEGMVIDSPVGKLELRKCDHQLALPMYFGRTKKVGGWEFLIATDIQTIPSKDYMPSCEEILRLRRK